MSADLRRRLSRFMRAHPALHDLVHPAYHALRRLLRARRLRGYGGALNGDPAAGNALIREAILSGRPHGIAKVGSLEAEALACFIAGTPYPDLLREQMVTNVGLFPGTPGSIDAFCDAYLQAMRHIDILFAWGNPGEAAVVARVPAPRSLVPIDSLEPWYFPDPWSSALAGKRVVVLSPFAGTIGRQYARRAALWEDRAVLPDFALRTVRMPLSPALAPSAHATWQERLAALTAEIDSEPHDVVIAGAGGISLLVAARACARGGVGFHMGGLTQILFGIMGRRWEKSAFIAARRNEAWTRPAGDEAPPTVTKVEQGCYW